MGGDSPARTRPNDCSAPAAVRTRRRRAAAARWGKLWANGARQPTSPLSQPRTVTSVSNDLPVLSGCEQLTNGAAEASIPGTGVGHTGMPESATASVILPASGGAPVSALDPSEVGGWSWLLEQLTAARATKNIRALQRHITPPRCITCT